jgi:hypothetical protein
VSVPAQDRRRRDQQSATATGGQESAEGGDHGSIGPADPWPRSAALQNGQLMTQDEISISLAASERVRSTIQLRSFANIWSGLRGVSGTDRLKAFSGVQQPATTRPAHDGRHLVYAGRPPRVMIGQRSEQAPPEQAAGASPAIISTVTTARRGRVG